MAPGYSATTASTACIVHVWYSAATTGDNLPTPPTIEAEGVQDVDVAPARVSWIPTEPAPLPRRAALPQLRFGKRRITGDWRASRART